MESLVYERMESRFSEYGINANCIVWFPYGYLPFGQRVAPCRSLASGGPAFVAPSAPMHRRALRSVLGEIPRTGHQNEKSTSNEVLRSGDPYGNRTHVSSVRG